MVLPYLLSGKAYFKTQALI